MIIEILLFEITLTLVMGFNIPGSYPNQFRAGDEIDVHAVKLTSIKTQLPYPYYSLNVCKPNKPIVYLPQNLGEILRGDRVVNTPFQIKMAEDRESSLLCPSIILSARDSNFFIKLIRETYFVHLMIDDLPVLSKHFNGKEVLLVHGYLIGFIQDGKVYLNNHLKFIIKYYAETRYLLNIVGFEIIPNSTWSQKINNSTVTRKQEIFLDRLNEIKFFYEVKWQKTNVKWTSRWEAYMILNDGKIHWFAIINSLTVITFLSGILAMIMLRTLRKDIAIYNKDTQVEEALEESGWKLVHGDIFRPPPCLQLFVALVGTGIQLFLVFMIILVSNILGLLSPWYRGVLLNATIFTYSFTGIFSGFFAGRLYKSLAGEWWFQTTILTGILFPGVLLSVGFVLNLLITFNNSSATMSVATIAAITGILFGVNLPLVFLGFTVGFNKPPYSHPVRINVIQREIPQQRFYQKTIMSMLSAGILPFGAVFIELFFVLTAIWETQFYNLFGYMFIVFIILIIAVAQVSIVMVYLQICSENYHWWWQTFTVSGGSAVYVFIFMVFYYFTKLQISHFISTLMYFCYSLMIAFTFWIITGTIGFYSSYYFLRRIYSAIKID